MRPADVGVVAGFPYPQAHARSCHPAARSSILSRSGPEQQSRGYGYHTVSEWLGANEYFTRLVPNRKVFILLTHAQHAARWIGSELKAIRLRVAQVRGSIE